MSERIKGLYSDINQLNKLIEAISKNPYKVYYEFLKIVDETDGDVDEVIHFEGIYGYFTQNANWSSISISAGDASPYATAYADLNGVRHISSIHYYGAIEAIINGLFNKIKDIEKEITRLEKANVPSLRPFELELFDGNYKFPNFHVRVYKNNTGNMGDCEKDVMTLSLAAPQRHHLTKYVTSEQAQNIGQVYLDLLIEARDKQKLTVDELTTEINKIAELLKDKP
jgi:hypothetical protein